MSTDEVSTCAGCGDELPIRPTVITGVTDTQPRRQFCLPCWRNGASICGGEE